MYLKNCLRVLTLITLMIFRGVLWAQDVPPSPPNPWDTEGEVDDKTDDGENGTSAPSFSYTNDVMAYVGYDWNDWNTRIREWFDAIGETSPLYPPLPKGYTFYIHNGIEVLRPPFTTVAERVMPTMVAGVPIWTVFVSECVDEDGTRTFETILGSSLCHQIPVSQFFNPKNWVLKWYGEDGKLPRWLANESSEMIQTWYEERDRSRFGFSVTFIREEHLAQYEANVAAIAEAERQRIAEQQTTTTENTPLRITAMEVSLGEVALSYYNRTGLSLGLLTARSLNQPKWDFWGSLSQSAPVVKLAVNF